MMTIVCCTIPFYSPNLFPVPSLKNGQQGHQLEFHQQYPGLSGGREGPWHSKDGEIMGISWEFLGNCGDLLEVSGKI
jgi:hypothetical protein